MHAGSAALRSDNVARGVYPPWRSSSRPEGGDPMPPQQRLTFRERMSHQQLIFWGWTPPHGDLETWTYKHTGNK